MIDRARIRAKQQLDKGDDIAAAAILRDALPRPDRIDMVNGAADIAALAAGHSDCAALHFSLGVTDTALAMAEYACRLHASHKSARQTYAKSLRNLATILAASDQRPRAIDVLMQAREIAEDPRLTAQISTELGELYASIGDSAKAKEALNSALATVELSGSLVALAAAILNRLGKLELSSAERAGDAEPYFHEALARSERITNPLEATQARGAALYNLALVRREAHRFLDAEVFQRKALQDHEMADPGSVATAQTLSFLALICWRRGSPERAIHYYVRAIDLIEKHVWLGGPTARRVILSQHHSPYRDLIACLHSIGPDSARCFDIAEALRARTIADSWVEAGPTSAGSLDAIPETVRKQRAARIRCARARSRLSSLWTDCSVPISQIKSAADDERNHREELLHLTKEVEGELPMLSYWRTPRTSAYSEVQASIPPGALMLRFLVTHDDLFTWIIGPGSERLVRGSLSESNVIELVSRSLGPYAPDDERVAPEEALAHSRDALSELSSVMLDPIAEFLVAGGLERIYLVADGELARLPVEALPFGPEKLPIGMQFETAYLPTASCLGRLIDDAAKLAGRRVSNGLTSFTWRSSQEPTASSAPRNPNLKSSSGARSDVPLHRVVEDAAIYAGSPVNVSPSVLLERSYVHLDGILILDDVNPLRSRIQAFTENESSVSSVAPFYVTDLTGSSVAWSIMSVAEARTRRARGYEGDSRLVFITAAFQAGIGGIAIPSDGRSSDYIDTLLLGEFYGALADGLSPATAMRRARERFANYYAHPLDWGRFALFGAG